METTNNNLNLQNKLVAYFEANFDTLTANDTPKVKLLRQNAINTFKVNGFPHKKMEHWRNSKIINALSPEYHFESLPNFDKDFACSIHDLANIVITLNNGFYSGESALLSFANGTIIGSTKAAMKQYPDLFEKHFGSSAVDDPNGFFDINTALWQDGFFIYVPKNAQNEKPIQIIKLINDKQRPLIQTRNIVILEEGSSLQIVDCDDTTDQQAGLINSYTEFIVGENAQLDTYKLQNLNDNTILVNTVTAIQNHNSKLQSNIISFNGGMIRNNITINLNHEGSEAHVYGLYLMDKKQHIDNQIKVNHNAAHCDSTELFKGILDDEATAVFNGHIYVAPDSQKTNAYQNNSNIILTPKAKVNTMPFLEIYADDVKCSHGTAIGQLDQEAMFYMRQRGVSHDNARMLLMYAFAAEISNHIAIESMQERIDDMIKKRLRGELSSCDTCVLHCSHPKEYHFDIDCSKL